MHGQSQAAEDGELLALRSLLLVFSYSRVHLIFHFGQLCAAFITCAPLTQLSPAPMPLTTATGNGELAHSAAHRSAAQTQLRRTLRQSVAILRFIVKWFQMHVEKLLILVGIFTDEFGFSIFFFFCSSFPLKAEANELWVAINQKGKFFCTRRVYATWDCDQNSCSAQSLTTLFGGAGRLWFLFFSFFLLLLFFFFYALFLMLKILFNHLCWIWLVAVQQEAILSNRSPK